jgi:hypothetical protein
LSAGKKFSTALAGPELGPAPKATSAAITPDGANALDGPIDVD